MESGRWSQAAPVRREIDYYTTSLSLRLVLWKAQDEGHQTGARACLYLTTLALDDTATLSLLGFRNKKLLFGKILEAPHNSAPSSSDVTKVFSDVMVPLVKL